MVAGGGSCDAGVVLVLVLVLLLVLAVAVAVAGAGATFPEFVCLAAAPCNWGLAKLKGVQEEFPGCGSEQSTGYRV